MQRPNMRFVPVKSEDQQARLMVHRAWQGFVVARTARINRIRGLWEEFGLARPLKAEVVAPRGAQPLGGTAGLCQTGHRRPAQRGGPPGRVNQAVRRAHLHYDIG